jgi:hypothetical protein
MRTLAVMRMFDAYLRAKAAQSLRPVSHCIRRCRARHGAFWSDWPTDLQDAHSPAVAQAAQ